MGSIAGSKKLKRQMAPTFWGINRKENRFVITVNLARIQKIIQYQLQFYCVIH